MPGEWAKTTYLGGGFLLNDFLASLSISERTKIEAFFFKDMLRFTANTMQQRIAANDCTTFISDGKLNNEVSRCGATFIESLGGKDDKPPLEETKQTTDEPYNYKYTTDQPYYSYQKIKGDIAQGTLESYTLPVNDVNTETPPGVLSVYKGYDGSYEVRAINSISFHKTSIIPVSWAHKEPDICLPLNERSEYDKEKYPLETSDLSFFGSEAVVNKDTYDLEKDSFSKFRVRDVIWAVPKDKEAVLDNLKNSGLIFSDQPELAALPITAPYYEEPPLSNEVSAYVDDEGKRSTKKNDITALYDMSSLIKQMPDGSIIISGGYGEEIRMYRGNIYITCPGDVISTPGRDSVVMAGGNNIQKANKGTAEIEGKTVTVLSEGNLQLAAGVGDSGGTMIIENKSTSEPNLKSYEKDMVENKSSGSGIIIKGKAVATISNDIYLQAEGGESDPLGVSNITMKSMAINKIVGNDITYLQKGGSWLVAGGTSMLSVGKGSINAVGDNGIRLNSRQVLCQTGKVEMPFKNDKDETETLTMGLGGSAQLVVQSTILAATVQAEYMSNNAGEVSAQGAEFSRNFSNIFTKPPPGSGFEKFRMSGLPLTVKFLHDKLKEWGIVMPSARYPKIELPKTRWQNMVDSEETWEQVKFDKSFKSDSSINKKEVSAYPGIDNFELKGSLKILEKEGTVTEEKLSDGLIINSK